MYEQQISANPQKLSATLTPEYSSGESRRPTLSEGFEELVKVLIDTGMITERIRETMFGPKPTEDRENRLVGESIEDKISAALEKAMSIRAELSRMEGRM